MRRLLLVAALFAAAQACTNFENYCDPKDGGCSAVPWITLQALSGGGCIPGLLGGHLHGCALSLAGQVTTVAGNGTNASVDGVGAGAQFNGPGGMTTDGIYLYVIEVSGVRVRRIEISTGSVTTVAGSTAGFMDGAPGAAQFNHPTGIMIEGGSLYVADEDNHRIRRVDIATGNVSTFAGGTPGFSDGVGVAAQFFRPREITSDGTNMYVGDAFNHRIRVINIATANVTTLAGNGAPGTTDGVGAVAQFDNPNYLTTDGMSLFVSDTVNNRIRKIDIATATVTTIAGGASGFQDGPGATAQFSTPMGITTDGTSLYVADLNNNRIRRIDIATNVVSTVAGSTSGFQDGSGGSAQFAGPRGITTDGLSLYVGDQGNHRIRRIQ